MKLNTSFTSTGEKLFYHQEVMQKLRDGKGQPIVTHIMPTDVCQHSCAFCSVQHRSGDSLSMLQIRQYLDQLCTFGLKSVIISGGGNPLLYRCRETGGDINMLIDEIHARGLEIGMITNGLPLKDYGDRWSWKTMRPETLDKLTWVRISLSGWDHVEDTVYTPDVNREITTLGASYVLHDIYMEPADKKHGKVSTLRDIVTPLHDGDGRVRTADSRLDALKARMQEWAAKHSPAYVRLLPNCLEPEKIAKRSIVLQQLAEEIDPDVFFVQTKPPRQPHACYKGYPHPVLNCDGWVYPCDSVVLNQSAGHKFGSVWRICQFNEVAEWYSRPIKPNVPNTVCPGCVFSDQVDLLASIVDGAATPLPDGPPPSHINFV